MNLWLESLPRWVPHYGTGILVFLPTNVPWLARWVVRSLSTNSPHFGSVLVVIQCIIWVQIYEYVRYICSEHQWMPTNCGRLTAKDLLRETYSIELERGKCIGYHCTQLGRNFVWTYGNSSAFLSQWSQFGLIFRLRIRKRNSANSLISL